ncbi:HesA/MoeB/ThiF family protein [Paludibacterium yongneupense]|uniref:HesA/MoeB/ThiF family protein n=1 Tax=Paludibacterium yongneupense TaxID=400061 RepID=UPI00041B5E9D|nr:molybdopterin-synthase adenylyltransferase MoeB [Paludibacterium yongneupense]
MSELDDKALLRYSRHILLPQIDIAGQEKLLAARALIVGAGGLGSPVALYLASAGVGRITLADDDTVELGNLQRQIAHDMASLGVNKARSAAARMHAMNPGVEIVALEVRLGGEALHKEVASHDVVIDCSDNFGTRQAINRAAVAARVPLVSGAAVAFAGQLAVFDARDAQSPCYHCLYPDEGAVGDGPCATFGVLSPLVGVVGSLQAVEAIKLLCGQPASVGRLTLYDAHDGLFRHLKLARDPACAVCGTGVSS